MNRRPLSPRALEKMLEDFSDEEDPYHASDESDSDYLPSDEEHLPKRPKCSFLQQSEEENSSDDEAHALEEHLSEEDHVTGESPDRSTTQYNGHPKGKDAVIHWYDIKDIANFQPRKVVPTFRNAVILARLDRSSSKFEIFSKLFPRSLFIYIAQNTNKRISMFNTNRTNKIALTDASEIMIVIGCMLVMSYNRVPSFHDYWSKKKSLGNACIKDAISRDRCTLLLSKMYYTDPEKPENCSKTYYVDELVTCLKQKFQSARSFSSHLSVDESMVKFKGRSSLKQYLPLKPIKRGVKIWELCDSKSGYVYNFDIYAGKEIQYDKDSTLGERVVKKLVECVPANSNTFICFDRFFTSVRLMYDLSFAATGTCIKNRKNVPQHQTKLARGDSKMLATTAGITTSFWQDTKEVVVVSNCHAGEMSEVQRKNKKGERITLQCPKSIADYNEFMGGVDLSDQLTTLYDFDRRSAKWWRKVFYKLLVTTIVNAAIIYNEVNHKKEKTLPFFIELAEELIGKGREGSKVVRKRSTGRPSSSSRHLYNVGDHLPVQGPTRRRCFRCAKRKKEVRTKIMCTTCDLPFCKECFTPFHT